MLQKIRKRLGSEKGFTLIELLVVMVILGILTAIAVPSYLSFRDRANKSAAKADVRAILPSVESYFADNGTYSGMSIANLKSVYDQSLDASIYALGSTLTDTTYCVQATSQNKTYRKNGPSAVIEEATC